MTNSYIRKQVVENVIPKRERLGMRDGLVIVVVFGFVAAIEKMTRQGGEFSFHRWREFEWLFLGILVVWYVLRGNDE
jgi:hypothetical protein